MEVYRTVWGDISVGRPDEDRFLAAVREMRRAQTKAKQLGSTWEQAAAESWERAVDTMLERRLAQLTGEWR